MRQSAIPAAREMEPQRLLARIACGDLANVSFVDTQRLVGAFDFELKRASGSHHIFANPEVRELLNLQEVHGKAKPYQIRQFLRLVERYALGTEEAGLHDYHVNVLQRRGRRLHRRHP